MTRRKTSIRRMASLMEEPRKRDMVAADIGLATCRFSLAYSGACGRIIDGGTSFCAEHAAIKCCSCGEQATYQCSYAGQFVCGAPLCNDCVGTNDMTMASGTWGFLNHFHRPKLGQRKMVAGDIGL